MHSTPRRQEAHQQARTQASHDDGPSWRDSACVPGMRRHAAGGSRVAAMALLAMQWGLSARPGAEADAHSPPRRQVLAATALPAVLLLHPHASESRVARRPQRWGLVAVDRLEPAGTLASAVEAI